MRFTAPFWLLLLPLLWWSVWWMGRQLLGMTRARKRFVFALRFSLLTLLVFALAGLQLVRTHKRVCTIFLLDVSESLSERDKEKALAFLRQALPFARPEDKVALILFGREAVVEVPPQTLRSLPPLYAKPDPSATNIASALRLGMALFPDGYAKRLVLLSDGNETHGNAQSVAAVARTEGIPIDVIVLPTVRRDREVLVTDVLMPSQVKVGQPFTARLIVEATTATKSILRVDQDGIPIKEIPVSLREGRNVLVVPLRSEEAGMPRYRFVLDAARDTDPRNNIGMGVVRVSGKPTVLLAEGEPDPTGALKKALMGNDIKVVQVREGDFPTRPEELQKFDAIILSDFPAYALSEGQMRAIQSALRDTGVGFIMIGGEKSFLPGGYYGTPIAKVLPVDLNVRQKKVFPAATIVIIMDTSGSMGMREGPVQKVHLAAKAAMETLKMLRPIDRFGVIVSGTGSDWLAPIQPARNKGQIIRRLSRVFAGGGGIYCRPSLELAAKAIVNEVTKVRHIIMLADADDCDEQEGCFEIARYLRALGVTITTVGFGSPNGLHAPFLKRLAHIGGGNYYFARSMRELPKLFTADISIMTRSAIVEETFLPRLVSDDEALHGIPWESVPPLFGYALASRRPLARTLMQTHRGDPLLALWNYGLGTSIAFTSDAKPKWARRWVKWEGFVPFWVNLVRRALRKGGRNCYGITVQVQRGEAVIELQAFTLRGEPIQLLHPEVTVILPSGESKKVVLRQEGLGQYQGRFPIKETGVYLVAVPEGGGEKGRVFTTGFAVPYPTEYRFNRSNQALLRQLAEITGGRLNPRPEEVFRLPERAGASVTDVWRLCLWSALVLFLIDIAIRRLVLSVPRLDFSFYRKLATLWEQIAKHPHPATETRARLLSIKRRMRHRYEGPLRTLGPSPPPLRPKPTPSPKDRSSPGTATQTTARLLDIKRRRRNP